MADLSPFYLLYLEISSAPSKSHFHHSLDIVDWKSTGVAVIRPRLLEVIRVI